MARRNGFSFTAGPTVRISFSPAESLQTIGTCRRLRTATARWKRARIRRRVDQLRKLRRDPLRQRGRLGAPPARYGARHDGAIEGLPGLRMRLLEVIDLADMLGRVGQLEADALAMPAGREAAARFPRMYAGKEARTCTDRVVILEVLGASTI